MRHVLTTSDFSKEWILALIERAELLRTLPRAELRQRLQGVVVATLFYEPSTRTRLSFESAVTKLGGRVVGAENARENSSAKKGETLEDVFRVVGSYVDCIVIRHHEKDAMRLAAPMSPVPIINAGAGAGEHPTQALLDVYTLWREFGEIDGLKLCVVGDLKYGRTVHSLLKMLAYFSKIQVTLLHPPSLGLPEELRTELADSSLQFSEGADFTEALQQADAVYQTRIQTERLASPDEAAASSQYAIGPMHLNLMQRHARILHPLPRVDEIAADVDTDERAAYFRQVENGLYIRMALLDDILGGIVQ